MYFYFRLTAFIVYLLLYCKNNIFHNHRHVPRSTNIVSVPISGYVLWYYHTWCWIERKNCDFAHLTRCTNFRDKWVVCLFSSPKRLRVRSTTVDLPSNCRQQNLIYLYYAC